MSLLSLPEELLMIIVKKLDIKAVYNLYHTCTRLRYIICLDNIVTECQLSLNNMATAKTLRTMFFKDICRSLNELDLCAVSDLNKSILMPVMKKLHKLTTLNVAFTNINILDLCQIHEACPTIKNISINFVMSKFGKLKITSQILHSCQNLFEKLDSVLFVGSLYTLMYSKLALCLLEKANLKSLKFMIAEREFGTGPLYEFEIPEHIIRFSNFNIYLLNWKIQNTYHGRLSDLSPLSMLDWTKYEYVIIIMEEYKSRILYTSPLLKTFFKNVFHIDSDMLTNLNEIIRGNVAVMLWNRETTEFNNSFYTNLMKEMQELLTCTLTAYDKSSLFLKHYKWFSISQILQDDNDDEECNERVVANNSKRRRIAPKNAVLNFDSIFEKQKDVRLCLFSNYHLKNPVSLSSNSNFLKKLTHLSLSGCVRYSSDFFNILFRCCTNLVTLNVEASSMSRCASSISRSIPLSSTIKNFRCLDKRVDFSTIFSSLSQCKTLENVHIIDASSDANELADPTAMFEKCNELYCLFICASMSDTVRTKKLQMLNKVKAKCGKPHINIELYLTFCDEGKYFYDPYLSVFKLNPIKAL